MFWISRLKPRFIFYFLILIWLQLCVRPAIAVRGIQPNFFFILLAFYGFRIDRKSLPMLALIFGLIEDLFSNTFFGLQTSSYVAGAIVLQFLTVRFDRDKVWIQVTSLFSAMFLSSVFFMILSIFFQPKYGFGGILLVSGFMDALYSVLISWVLFPVFEKWLKPMLAKQYELF